MPPILLGSYEFFYMFESSMSFFVCKLALLRGSFRSFNSSSIIYIIIIILCFIMQIQLTFGAWLTHIILHMRSCSAVLNHPFGANCITLSGSRLCSIYNSIDLNYEIVYSLKF